jgi:hypothetical protein
MKQFIILITATLCMIVSCNNNKTGNSAVDTTGKKTEPAGADDDQKKTDRMKGLQGLTAGQVKTMFPEELGGLKQTEYRAFNDEGYEIGEATYTSDDGKELELTIFDCVGDAGVGRYSIMYLSAVNTQSEDGQDYQKPVDFEGVRAIETYQAKENRYSFLFPAGDRLLVKVVGIKTGPELVKKAGASLSLR